MVRWPRPTPYRRQNIEGKGRDPRKRVEPREHVIERQRIHLRDDCRHQVHDDPIDAYRPQDAKLAPPEPDGIAHQRPASQQDGALTADEQRGAANDKQDHGASGVDHVRHHDRPNRTARQRHPRRDRCGDLEEPDDQRQDQELRGVDLSMPPDLPIALDDRGEDGQGRRRSRRRGRQLTAQSNTR